MKIALIGYGKMGKEIEKIALSRGHSVNLKIDVDNPGDLSVNNLKMCDVAIEFTIPSSAVNNYFTCFEAGIPVVSGTTGWLSEKEKVHQKCSELGGTFFYASNFSVGVNIFFQINRKLAQLMATQGGYDVEMTEVHHTQKLDSPSGTGITLADDVIAALPWKEKWVSDSEPMQNEMNIKSERVGQIPGIHTIRYESEADFIEITHSAKNRSGFALGAVLAAEYSFSRKGVLSMADMLNF